MPATEQTWRNPRLLHAIFGLSSLAFLVSTIWILAVDHNREFKRYKRDFRRLETWQAVARVNEQESAVFEQDLASKRAAWEAEQERPLSTAGVQAFLAIAQPLAEQNEYDLEAVSTAQDHLSELGEDEDVAAARQELLASLQAIVTQARFTETTLQTSLKFRRAELDAAKSQVNMGVATLPDQELASMQRSVEQIGAEVETLNLDYQAARTQRVDLDKALAGLTQAEADAKKAYDDQLGKLTALQIALKERSANFQKSLLELPIIDAFGGPLKPDQIWLPQLYLNNNFRDVARFDRCITCHQGIDKTAAGSAVKPGYTPLVTGLAFSLDTPAAPPSGESSGSRADQLEQVYGLVLADQGLLDPADVTISVVRPGSLAARARLMSGDLLREIDGVRVLDHGLAYSYLLDSVDWGKPIPLTIDRGVPQPFSSHPRLDLFLGSLSPHKQGDVGCTICHEGQGSATDFKWASHMPNSPRAQEDWQRDHDWFNNHHWILPQLPKRFLESSCLKCHHNVAELEPSQRFPDPPAPKLVEGYNLIREYGCFGCHEINGYDGPNKRRGPDLRAEPNYYSAAAGVLLDPGLTAAERALAMEVIAHPELEDTRMRLAELLLAEPIQLVVITQVGGPTFDDDFAGDAAEVTPASIPAADRLLPSTRKLAALIGATDETPGTYRKVGPSLRHLSKKVDLDFVMAWLKDPTQFRPSTKMPRFFGLHSHLDPGSDSLADAERFEAVEIRSAAEYLLHASGELNQPGAASAFEYAERPADVTEEPSVERGKILFEQRGCLACHQHQEFPAAKSHQGPDLSRIGAKLKTKDPAKGERWLYSWVRQPNRYHARTVMPDLQLDVIREGETVTDPADDIAVYLFQSQDWRPEALGRLNEGDLDALALTYLQGTFTPKQAERYLREGIPENLRGELKGDEVELVGSGDLLEKKLLYVGRRTINRLGCAGCHDIPGFEEAKSIGTNLADWGRKETSKLAFEQIVPYLTGKLSHGDAHGGSDATHGGQDATHGGQAAAHGEQADAHGGQVRTVSAQTAGNTEHGHLSPRALGDDTGYFVETLLNHERIGFLWQKLREPRSYDYKMTENKLYTDRLRMPKFNFSDEQVEAVMTFVLGLVAEPPTARYIYQPTPRRQAILAGQQILTKYNCGGCHQLQMDTWEFDYDPATWEGAPEVVDFEFLRPHFTPEQLAASKQLDARGLGHATVVGRPNLEQDGLEGGKDEEGNYYFTLWEPAAIHGATWWPAEKDLTIPEGNVVRRRAGRGGDFARLLFSAALEMARGNPDLKNFKPANVWGWLPPPLVGEGRKVQTAWLHDFLLDPHLIRPAALLRMPKFNMTSAEASQLVNYFAALDGVEFPYEFDSRTRGEYLAAREAEHPQRLDQALTLVTNNNFCVQCHLVGDYVPKGSVAALAPNLDRVHDRLRPDFVERWIAHPSRLLPYTGMPVNFEPAKPADQKLFTGTSLEQIQGLVDLLMNFDSFMERRSSLSDMVVPATEVPAADAPDVDSTDAPDVDSEAATNSN